MAGTSLLTLLDDIASMLDDVAAMTKVAAKKTAGVVGDDLALNAQQVTGVASERELYVVWSVAKGSMINKAILIPLAILISVIAPMLITPLLMVGGSFLCYEGAHKLWEKWHARKSPQGQKQEHLLSLSDEEFKAVEKEKIKGAIKTDFILSAEILVIALGAAVSLNTWGKVGVLTTIGVLMTVGVYGLVAMIVKMDDLGLYMMKSSTKAISALGQGLVNVMPKFMKVLAFLGTAAMFAVGGDIVIHGIPMLYELQKQLPSIVPTLAGITFGIVWGAVIVAILEVVSSLRNKKAAQ